MPDYVAAYDDITAQLTLACEMVSDLSILDKNLTAERSEASATVQRLQDMQKALASLPEVSEALTKRAAAAADAAPILDL